MNQHQVLLISSNSFLAQRNAAALTVTVLTLSHRGREGKRWLSDVWHLSTYHPPPMCPGSGRDLESVTRCKGICVLFPVHLGGISHGHMHGFCSRELQGHLLPNLPCYHRCVWAQHPPALLPPPSETFFSHRSLLLSSGPWSSFFAQYIYIYI